MVGGGRYRGLKWWVGGWTGGGGWDMRGGIGGGGMGGRVNIVYPQKPPKIRGSRLCNCLGRKGGGGGGRRQGGGSLSSETT